MLTLTSPPLVFQSRCWTPDLCRGSWDGSPVPRKEGWVGFCKISVPPRWAAWSPCWVQNGGTLYILYWHELNKCITVRQTSVIRILSWWAPTETSLSMICCAAVCHEGILDSGGDQGQNQIPKFGSIRMGSLLFIQSLFGSPCMASWGPMEFSLRTTRPIGTPPWFPLLSNHSVMVRCWGRYCGGRQVSWIDGGLNQSLWRNFISLSTIES